MCICMRMRVFIRIIAYMNTLLYIHASKRVVAVLVLFEHIQFVRRIRDLKRSMAQPAKAKATAVARHAALGMPALAGHKKHPHPTTIQS